MEPTPGARVRSRREARGMTQLELARASQLSRQSVGSIEAARSLPSVDVALRLAAALDTTVEELFGAPPSERTLIAESAGRTQGRVALAHVGGRWVAHAVSGQSRLSADGISPPSRAGRVRVEPTRPVSELRENVLVLGCAMGLGIVADRLGARGGGRYVWLPASSTGALEALGKQRAHVAGVHLVDARSGEANAPDVARHVEEPVVLVTLGAWEAGWVVAAGNPLGIRRTADLARRGLRVVTREPGSGARRLYDRALRAEGVSIDPSRVVAATGHAEVAQLVALGAADVGIATRDAAIAFGLELVPLAEERYDLAVPQSSLDDPRIARLLDTITAAGTRRELDALGYDTRSSGTRVSGGAA